MNKHPRRRLPRLVLILCLIVVGVAVLAPPWSLVGKADWIAFATCHRLPERTFWLGGRPLPLCARCSGTYLGVMASLAVFALLRRRRASQFPPLPLLPVLVVFVAAWGLDGLNSFLSFFPGVPTLYEPQNWLRLATGLLNGIALANLVVPVFNFTLWADANRERVLARWPELGLILLLAAGLGAAVVLGVDAALVPLAALSGLGALAMLLMTNSIIAAVLLRRESYATAWREALPTLLVGAAITCLELAGLITLRASVTAAWGPLF